MSIAISIIIPVYKENSLLPLLTHLDKLRFRERSEIILVDGDPEGSSIKPYLHQQYRCILAPQGRGIQMNYGAAIAKGHILMFLHADTFLHKQSLGDAIRIIDHLNYDAGCFSLSFNKSSFRYQWLQFWAMIRGSLLGYYFGDQVLFVKKETFNSLGGFLNCFCEDFFFLKLFRKQNYKFKLSSLYINTSVRKWKNHGFFNTLFKHLTIQLFLILGAGPTFMTSFFTKSNQPPTRTCLAVMIKDANTEPVKSRLAVSTSDDFAEQLYQAMIKDTLARFQLKSVTIMPCVKSKQPATFCNQWQIKNHIQQRHSDLGKNLVSMSETLCSTYPKIIFLGSDSPNIPRQYIVEAIKQLTDHDAVIGPTDDGGYYLIGIKSFELAQIIFTDMPWSTPNVFYETCLRLQQNDLVYYVLPKWYDIDNMCSIHKLKNDLDSNPLSAPNTYDFLTVQQKVTI